MVDTSWLIATLIFLVFCVLFLAFGNEPIRSFTLRQRFNVGEEPPGESESDKRIATFLQEFEGYLKNINNRNKFRYRIAAGGFFIAALTSLLLAFAMK